MTVEILDYQKKPSGNKLGNIIIKYHDLLLRCELMFYPKTKTAWVKMPEQWIVKDKKFRYCYWPDKDTSDAFQKLVLNKLFDKYDLNQAAVEDIFLKSRLHKPEKKIIDQ